MDSRYSLYCIKILPLCTEEKDVALLFYIMVGDGPTCGRVGVQNARRSRLGFALPLSKELFEVESRVVGVGDNCGKVISIRIPTEQARNQHGGWRDSRASKLKSKSNTHHRPSRRPASSSMPLSPWK